MIIWTQKSALMQPSALFDYILALLGPYLGAFAELRGALGQHPVRSGLGLVDGGLCCGEICAPEIHHRG